MALGLKKSTKPGKPAAPVLTKPATIEGQKPPAPYKFPAKQAAFMDHWMVTRNATEAAKLAGFAKKSAHVEGHRVLNDPKVRAELDRRIEAQREKLELSSDWVVQRLMRLAMANMADYMDVNADGSPVLSLAGLTRDQAYALDSVTVEEFKDGRSDKREVRRVKFAMADRVKSLELLGRRLKLFGDTVDVNHKHQLTLVQMMLQEIDAESRGKVIEHQK